jgi:hypothetical protein
MLIKAFGVGSGIPEGATTFSITTLYIMTFSILILSIKVFL